MVSRMVNFCDRCGGETPATETVRFKHEGKALTMDVCAQHRTEWLDLQEQVAAWAEISRPELVTSRRSRDRSRKSKAAVSIADSEPTQGGGDAVSTPVQPARRRESPERGAAVRAWAVANGYPLAERGRLPAEVIEAYDAEQAHARWDGAATGAERPDEPGSTDDASPASAGIPGPAGLVGRPTTAASSQYPRPQETTTYG